MEINEDQLNETGKSYLFRACYSNGVVTSHHHLHFGRDSKSGKRMGKLYSEKKGKHWVCCLDREAVGGLSGSRVPM